MSCSANSCLCASYWWNLALILCTPITRVILGLKSEGKAGEATMSLYVRWGSAVIRHIVVAVDVLRECGREILAGFNRFWSIMCFFVVRFSHTGISYSSLSSLSSVAANKLRLLDVFVFSIWLFMNFSRAREALRTCQVISSMLVARSLKKKKRSKNDSPDYYLTDKEIHFRPSWSTPWSLKPFWVNLVVYRCLCMDKEWNFLHMWREKSPEILMHPKWK